MSRSLHLLSCLSRLRSRPLRCHRVFRIKLLSSVMVLLVALYVGPAAYSAELPGGEYVALGDSYASGFGVSPYESGTDVDGGNECKRSTAAYPQLVGQRIGRTPAFHACSGARTGDLYQAKTAWDEPAQLDALSQSTGVVTLSIGGNDAGFAQVLGDCIGGWRILPFITCSGDKQITDRVDSAIDALGGTGEQDGIHSYEQIMGDIASRAPNATVVAVGYPSFYSSQGRVGGIIPGRCEGVKKVDQRWITAKTNELNTALKAAALRHGHQFTDPSDSFAGHELCGEGASWFQGLLNSGRFHPNADGHKAMATSVMNTLNDQQAAQEQPAAAQAQVDNMRPTGSFTLTRNGDQITLDASASTDTDGTITNVDWYIQHADGAEEVLTGAQATTTVPADQQVSITAVVTDNQGKEDFTTQVAPAS